MLSDGLRQLSYAALSVAGVNAILRLRRPGAPILCYHNVRATTSRTGDVGLHMPLDRFVAQMEWLSRKFDVVPLAELRSRHRRAQSLRGLAVLTFDDGYSGVLEYALPVLAGLGLPCTIFVTGRAPTHPVPFWWDRPDLSVLAGDPAHRERLLVDLRGDGERIKSVFGSLEMQVPADCLPAGWAALRAARSTMVEIGAHTMSHPNLVATPDHDLRDELSGVADAIAAGVGVRPVAFAYPYGRWDLRVTRAVDDAGYDIGVTLEAHDVVPRDSALALARINIPSTISISAFAAWVSGLSDLRARRS
jgi:peptidoglycan/xylan/chitin deacetylase (PgdA/CDA1 family)